jgi:hypothetical protein
MEKLGKLIKLENGLKVHQNQWDLLQKLEGINNKTGYNRRQKQSLVFGWLCVFFPIFVSPKWRKLGRQAATASGAETLATILAQPRESEEKTTF